MTTSPLPPAHHVGAVGAVIVAAGASARMQGADKTLADLGGEPLIARTVDAFERCGAVGAIVLVVAERNIDDVAALRDAKGWRKTAPPILGGARRQDTVRAGLAALPPECEWVVVHDGARPFVTPAIIEAGLAAAQPTGAAVAVVPAFDTVKRIDADGRIVETLDRSELVLTQTPQVFRRDILERAHAEIADDVTDDAAMVERIGTEVRTFEGARSNIKVTTPEDLALARVGAIWVDGFREKMDQIVYREGFIDLIEDRTASEIYKFHSREFRTIEIGLELLFNTLDRIVPGELPTISYVRLQLAIQGLHSLSAAALVLKRGYYSQSLGLVRMAMEPHLIARYIKNHPEIAEMLLDDDSDNWRGPSFTDMANEFEDGEDRLKRYGYLSEITHPRNLSLRMLRRDDKITLYPSYSKDQDDDILLISIYHLLGEIKRYAGLAEEIGYEIGLSHSETAIAVQRDIDAKRQEIEETTLALPSEDEGEDSDE